MREGGQTGSTTAVRAPPGREAGPPITLGSVQARERHGLYGSFWALLGDRLNAPCSSSTGEPGGGSTVTPPAARHRERPWLAQSGLGARDTARRTAGHHRPAGTHSPRTEQLCWSAGHITHSSPTDCAELGGFQWAVTLKTWGKGDSEFCLLQVSAGASAVSRRGER